MELFIAILFIGAIISFLIKAGQPARKIARKPKHKQYNENRDADYYMKQVSKAYSIEIKPDESLNEEGDEVEEEDKFSNEYKTTFSESYEIRNLDDIDEDLSPTQKGLRALKHPSQFFFTLGSLWFLGFAILDNYYPNLFITNSKIDLQLVIAIVPAAFLIGLSGLKIVVSGEYMSKFGEITTGTQARVTGVIRMIVSLAISLLIIFSTFNN